jgi:NADH-quinone oxidoreductase subunit C
LIDDTGGVAGPEGAPASDEADVPAVDPHALDDLHAALLAALRDELGDGVVDATAVFGHPVVRVRADAWRHAAEVARTRLACDFLSFVSAIDWQPAPREGDDAGGDSSAPVQPPETTYGATGSAGRFQVFAHVESTSRHWGVTLKVDVDEAQPVVPSWVPVYAGAEWHERECWEMFGIAFDGHPGLRHLYLPAAFEGHPLRKDFPLLARAVKPWPGLVDVEPMPGEEPAAEGPAAEGPAAEAPAIGGDAE